MGKTRITTGLLKGRQIDIPSGIRPTQEKIRKAIFDILQQEIKEVIFLELYAGSAAVGIEAISNGAKEVVFAEKDKVCCRIIGKNLVQLGLVSTDILNVDAVDAIEILYKQNKKFDIVFFDPPYYEGLAKKTLQKLSAYDILTPHCQVLVEHHKRDPLEESIGNLTRFKQKRYGDTLLSFYRRQKTDDRRQMTDNRKKQKSEKTVF